MVDTHFVFKRLFRKNFQGRTHDQHFGSWEKGPIILKPNCGGSVTGLVPFLTYQESPVIPLSS